jgi:very-short-patch-repair endonuclease
LVELADALTRRHRPATTTAALAAALGRHDRARGAAKARTALALCVAGTDSIPETDLRLLLVRAGLPTPEVNLPVKVGRETLYLDLAYKDKRAAAEYDGAYHVGDRGQMQRDAARRRALEDLGWRIITVTAADLVTDPAGVVASIRQALR